MRGGRSSSRSKAVSVSNSSRTPVTTELQQRSGECDGRLVSKNKSRVEAELQLH